MQACECVVLTCDPLGRRCVAALLDRLVAAAPGQRAGYHRGRQPARSARRGRAAPRLGRDEAAHRSRDGAAGSGQRVGGAG